MIVILNNIDHQSFQLLTLNITSLLILLILATLRPYQDPRLNVSMVILEGINLIILDFMQAFTDFSQSAKDRVIIAWIVLSILMACAIVNTMFLMKHFIYYIRLIIVRNKALLKNSTVKLHSS